MDFPVRPFRKFQWQLSLSYTLVAVASLLVVELLLVGGLLVLLNSDPLPRMLVTTFREQFGANLRTFLDRPSPDIAGMNRFLSAYTTNGQAPAQNVPDAQLWSASESSQNMLVIGPGQEILWTQYTSPDWVVGKAFEHASVPGVERILPAALRGASEPENLYTRSGDLLVMTVPIESAADDGSKARVLAVMIFQLEMPTMTNPVFMSQLLPPLLISLLAFTLFSGLVGSVFGYFTARRLTRRLGRVSAAADAWSRGDFSTFIPDTTGDELGALARRLNAMAEQLQNLLDTRQELATLEERNRIARELHDSVKQEVFATAMQLGAARALIEDHDSPAAQRLAEAERLTRQAQSELTALIQQLRPVALEGKGLARALRELTTDWSRQTGISAIYESTGGQNEPPLHVMQEQALYRVAQEALANIARHSRARGARVTFTRGEGQTQLTITDDGDGFDPQRQNGQGVGLKSMRERVEALGGTLEIESMPGKGTRLLVALPHHGFANQNGEGKR